jgi:hypothetical protein
MPETQSKPVARRRNMSRAKILFLGSILAVFCFIILNTPAGAKDEQAEEAVKMYFAAKDDNQRAYILKVIKKSGASLDDLAAALPGRREFEKPETKNNVCSHKFDPLVQNRGPGRLHHPHPAQACRQHAGQGNWRFQVVAGRRRKIR